MKTKLSEVSCKYGAPMGRSNSIPADIQTSSKLYLEKLEWVDGDYTKDGTYWGGGSGDYIYRATGETQTEVVEIFVRAKDRAGAKQQVREIFKDAKFFR